MKRTLLIFTTAIASFSFAQNVNIPDANFKAYLVGEPTINTNADTEIQVSEAQAFAGTIICMGLNISDLTGIEAFTNIVGLAFSDNQISSVDLSQNTLITSLSCFNNQLTSLDISNNPYIVGFNCGNNQLATLDLSQHSDLVHLNCYQNQLTSLDLSNNLLLENVWCYANQLTALDVTSNNFLVKLDASQNQITQIDLTQNGDLEELVFNYNQLADLDLSQNPVFEKLLCKFNLIASLNLKNGNNTAMTNQNFEAQNNLLTCIEVDDSAYSTSNWTNIDAGVSFSEDCNGGVGLNENELTMIEIYPNPATDMIQINSTSQFIQASVFTLSGRMVLQTEQSTLDISNLDAGVYIVSTKTESGIHTSRFIKE